MNICEKCGLSFYGKEGQSLCGNCRVGGNKGNGARTVDGKKDAATGKRWSWREWWRRFYGVGRG